MSPLRARLDLEPADAIRFFEAKGEQLAWDYTDVWREANVHAFTVAKATSLEVLRTIRAEVSKAIGTGRTFQDFKRTLQPRLQDLGWWGAKDVLDADTGELTRTQLGSVRRLRTIYQTNVQTAYMAGRFKRYTANAADRPFWRYVAIMDGRTRPAHAALNGKVWRHDDPIWGVIWPPNGWGCRCRVDALTRSEFDGLGMPLEDGRDAIVETQVVLNKVGDTATVQGVRYRDANGKEMVFRPDPGWDYNPGAEWSRFDPAGFKGEAVEVPSITPRPAAGVIKSIAGQQSWDDLGRPDVRAPGVPRQADPGLLQQIDTTDGAVDLMTRVLVPDGKLNVVQTPIEQVAIRPELIPHTVDKRADGRERYANYVLATLENPFEVWLTAYDDGSYRKRYIGLFAAERDLLVVVRENRDGSLMWELYNLMQRDGRGINKLREGVLLYAQE
ncbi:MAG: minor capsid protein [Proteobacteria bacterium]|nr:minor capsid protein [Pseudomonadota bacterium]